ncbi:MAG TPA: hypothetical protein PLI51_00190 [bacterium]|nr:hypothetical protein [bacterium]HPQ65130.1 hypothetical protein [bacterium]
MNPKGMSVLTVLFTLAFTVPIAASSDGPHLGIEIGEPTVKVVEGPDYDNDLTISISVRVKNTTEREVAVEVIVQGLDREGAELFDTFLNDALKPGQTRVFTDSVYIRNGLYKSIVIWRVEEATIRGGEPNNAPQRTHSPDTSSANKAPASRH